MKLSSFLICDDIRQELGNKQSLIGIYDDTLNFDVPLNISNKWPKVIKLGVFIKLMFDDDTEKNNFHRIRLEYTSNNETVQLLDSTKQVIPQNQLNGITISIVTNQLLIKASGDMPLRCIIFDRNNKIIGDFTKKIIVQERIMQHNINTFSSK